MIEFGEEDLGGVVGGEDFLAEDVLADISSILSRLILDLVILENFFTILKKRMESFS